jgi:hypothetical protein
MLNEFSGDDLAHFSGALTRRPGQPLPEDLGGSRKPKPFYIVRDIVEPRVVRANALDEFILALPPAFSVRPQSFFLSLWTVSSISHHSSNMLSPGHSPQVKVKGRAWMLDDRRVLSSACLTSGYKKVMIG